MPDEQTTAVAEVPETQAIEKHVHPKPPMMSGKYGLQLNTLDDIYRFAQYVATSGMVSKMYRDNPAAAVIAIEYGLELEMRPMQAIQNIMVINERPALWGDAVPGICMSKPYFQDMKIIEFGKPYNDDYGFEVTVWRKGIKDPFIARFTVADAKLAKLWQNPSKDPWCKYPRRMLMSRARTFALRDAFPDALKGIQTAEELRDIHDAEVVQEPQKSRTETLAEMVAADAEYTDQNGATVTPAEPEPEQPQQPEFMPAERLMVDFNLTEDQLVAAANDVVKRKITTPDDVKPGEWEKVREYVESLSGKQETFI